jgi:hypothetical protein
MTGVFYDLCAATGTPARDVLPDAVPADVKDRITAAAIAGGDVREACGDAKWQDGFRRAAPLKDYPSFEELTSLVRRAQREHTWLEREIADLTRRRDTLARLLNPQKG